MKAKQYVGTLLFTIVTVFFAQGQIAVSNLEEIAKIKKGTTYVAMKDPTSEKAKEYISVFKSTWNLSKVEVIKY